MYWKPITELRIVACHMGSHMFTCHPTQVSAPRRNPSHAGRCSIYLPQRDGRLSWPWCWLYTVMVYLSQTVTHPGTNNLIATRPGVEPTTSRVQRPNRYTTKPPSSGRPKSGATLFYRLRVIDTPTNMMHAGTTQNVCARWGRTFWDHVVN